MGQSKKEIYRKEDWEMLLSGLSIDCAIFGYDERELKVLILEFENTDLHALPGGFIKQDEDINEAASRILYERTGLKDIFLSQFKTFGKQDRHDDEKMKMIMENNDIKYEDDHFLLGRFVSIGYVALVDYKRVEPKPGILSSKLTWHDLDSVPSLFQDHQHIIDEAMLFLRNHVDDKLLGANLLVDTFTMKDLQKLHETVLGEQLHRTGFHRKMMDSGHLERLGKKKTGRAHRSPYLYRFSKGKDEKTA